MRRVKWEDKSNRDFGGYDVDNAVTNYTDENAKNKSYMEIKKSMEYFDDYGSFETNDDVDDHQFGNGVDILNRGDGGGGDDDDNDDFDGGDDTDDDDGGGYGNIDTDGGEVAMVMRVTVGMNKLWRSCMCVSVYVCVCM